MPTIDQLAPATAAADSDEILVSQNGVTRKITRAQVLSGVQPTLALPAGSLLGRSSAGVGTPETITIGGNLSLSGTTLSAAAAPFVVSSLPTGTVPTSADAVALGQSGTNTSVTYGQFMSGLPGVPNVNASQVLVTPTGSSTSVKLADMAASTLPLAGGTMTGPLVLSGTPTASGQAATKGYVDSQVASALPRSGGSLTGALTLPSDPSSALQASTKQYVDARIIRSGDTLTGALVLAADPTVPLQAATKHYVDGLVGTALPLAGGTMTGGLTLSSPPTMPLGAATKQYVDTAATANGVINIKSSPYNALLNGVADDTAAFKAAYIAAPTGSAIYVPFGVTVLQNPNTWGVALTKRVKWIVDGTTLVDGTPLASAIPSGTNPVSITLPGIVVGNTAEGAEVSLAGSQTTDFAVQHSSYIVNHTGGTSSSVIANARTDTLIYNSPNNYVWGGLDRLIWTGIQTPTAATPAQHVGRYVQSIRQTIGTNSSGAALPQPQMWAACLEMRDTTGQPSSMSNATLTVEMDFIANGLDDANNRQIQSLVIEQNDTTGAPVEVGTIIGVYLGAGSTGHAKNVFNVNVPFNNAVLNTTNATQLTGGSAIRLAAGHSIAFEPSGSNNLAYDTATGTLRWNQGSLSYVVGKGITVGWQYVATGNATLPNYIAGDLVFLTGSGTYTISLPAANSVPPGVGFTFSNIGTATVTIAPAGTDTIDNGPITLRSNDRYHIASDGSSSWREIFRTNSVSPRFTGPPVLPSYTVAALPSAPGTGGKAFAINGRKPSEATGAGTGVEVFFDGSHWISVCSGTQVAT